MKTIKSVAKLSLRFGAGLLGVGLLIWLIVRAGPRTVWNQVHSVGLGMVIVIILGGIGYLLRTWAWRRTFLCDISRLSWSRSYACCLVSEALGLLGAGGKVLGEGMRISLVGSAVPVSNAIPASAIDGGLHVASSAIVSLTGLAATLVIAPLTGKLRIAALIFTFSVVTFLVFAAISIAHRWELMGNLAKALGRVPRLHKWISAKQPVITSSEHNLLNFFRQAPSAFFAALLLNFLWQALAILEIYIILRFMGASISVVGAFVLEALTKLINVVGLLNPGNVGTYEGGNMVITHLIGISGTAGLSLALCRRARALFWALIGALCLVLMSKPRQSEDHKGADAAAGLGRL